METDEVPAARLRQMRHLELLAHLLRNRPHADGVKLARMSRDALLARALGQQA